MFDTDFDYATMSDTYKISYAHFESSVFR